ncbi:MAG: hypothetical protein Aurels2KO_17290 [Aureliella sp.]
MTFEFVSYIFAMITFGVLWLGLSTGKGVLAELGCLAVAMLFSLLQSFAERRPVASFSTLLNALQLVSLAATTVVVIRLGVKLYRGRTAAIADLLRLTVVAAVVLSVLKWQGDPVIAALIACTSCSVYCGAALAWGAMRKRLQKLAAVGAVGFIALCTQVIATTSYFYGTPAKLWLDLAVLTGLLVAGGAACDWFLGLLCCRWGPWGTAVVFSLRNTAANMRLASAIRLWRFRPGVCYLNHGSFGAVPLWVEAKQQALRRQFAREPMDFMTRHYERLWLDTRRRLSAWVGAAESNVALCENATAGMNEIAGWFPLNAGDEVLLNNHEYGAVIKTWRQRCESAGAKVRIVSLPTFFESTDGIVQAILNECSDATRLVVVSHITSATAMRMPVERLCEELSARGISVCIDGPHAPFHEPLALERLGCDFYTASCHKWLSAPIGSGFLYVAPKWHALARPLRVSWGRLSPAKPSSWDEELIWSGTRDSSAMLSVVAAIKFQSNFDRDKLHVRNHRLAQYARARLLEIPGAKPLTPDSDQWYGWMVSVCLPEGDHSGLQERLWKRYRIEIPIFEFEGHTLIRVSCPLYVRESDIDYLMLALRRELANSMR